MAPRRPVPPPPPQPGVPEEAERLRLIKRLRTIADEPLPARYLAPSGKAWKIEPHGLSWPGAPFFLYGSMSTEGLRSILREGEKHIQRDSAAAPMPKLPPAQPDASEPVVDEKGYWIEEEPPF